MSRYTPPPAGGGAAGLTPVLLADLPFVGGRYHASASTAVRAAGPVSVQLPDAAASEGLEVVLKEITGDNEENVISVFPGGTDLLDEGNEGTVSTGRAGNYLSWGELEVAPGVFRGVWSTV